MMGWHKQSDYDFLVFTTQPIMNLFVFFLQGEHYIHREMEHDKMWLKWLHANTLPCCPCKAVWLFHDYAHSFCLSLSFSSQADIMKDCGRETLGSFSEAFQANGNWAIRPCLIRSKISVSGSPMREIICAVRCLVPVYKHVCLNLWPIWHTTCVGICVNICEYNTMSTMFIPQARFHWGPQTSQNTLTDLTQQLNLPHRLVRGSPLPPS